jgi:hypothetical protein
MKFLIAAVLALVIMPSHADIQDINRLLQGDLNREEFSGRDLQGPTCFSTDNLNDLNKVLNDYCVNDLVNLFGGTPSPTMARLGGKKGTGTSMGQGGKKGDMSMPTDNNDCGCINFFLLVNEDEVLCDTFESLSGSGSISQCTKPLVNACSFENFGSLTTQTTKVFVNDCCRDAVCGLCDDTCSNLGLCPAECCVPDDCEVAGSAFTKGEFVLPSAELLDRRFDLTSNVVYDPESGFATSAVGTLTGVGSTTGLVGKSYTLGTICVGGVNPGKSLPTQLEQRDDGDFEEDFCTTYTVLLFYICNRGSYGDCGYWDFDEVGQLNKPVCDGSLLDPDCLSGRVN